MSIRRTLLTAVLAAVAAAAAIVPTALPAQTRERDGLVRDAEGRTLYVHDDDRNGRPGCEAECAAVWPPFVAGTGIQPVGQVTLHERKDGRLQWGWNGRPLYYYAGDAAPGDAHGNGREGRWHVVSATSPAQTPALFVHP